MGDITAPAPYAHHEYCNLDTTACVSCNREALPQSPTTRRRVVERGVPFADRKRRFDRPSSYIAQSGMWQQLSACRRCLLRRAWRLTDTTMQCIDEKIKSSPKPSTDTNTIVD